MKKFLLIWGLLLVFYGSSFAVDLNKATQAELEALKGIGPVKAKAIIAYRNTHGAFKSADDLDKVNGVGKGIIEKIGADVTIDGRPLGMLTAGDEPADRKTTKVKNGDDEAEPEAAPVAAPADAKPVNIDRKNKK